MVYVDAKPTEGFPYAKDETKGLHWKPAQLHTEDACYIAFESHQKLKTHENLPFIGVIDELLIFRRPMTLDEIKVFSRL